MILSPTIEAALNKQVAMEAAASQKYLAMACWADVAGLQGCARFLYSHSDEERMHMLKLVHYISDAGGKAITPMVEQPILDYQNIIQLFEKAYSNELKVSAAIDELVEICVQNKDKQTANFLQWYLDEQHEEEVLYRNLLDRIRLIGLQDRGLYFIDKEVEDLYSQKQATEKKKSKGAE